MSKQGRRGYRKITVLKYSKLIRIDSIYVFLPVTYDLAKCDNDKILLLVFLRFCLFWREKRRL